MTTTDGKCYFVAVKSLEKLEIQFVPAELNFTRNTTTEAVQIVGRNNPLYHYTAGETLLSFELDFYAAEESRQDVIRKCRWLEALAANDGFENPPEQVKLVFGDLFRDEVWIVKNVNYKISNFNKEFGFLPQQAYVTISLGLDPKANLKTKDIQ